MVAAEGPLNSVSTVQSISFLLQGSPPARHAEVALCESSHGLSPTPGAQVLILIMAGGTLAVYCEHYSTFVCLSIVGVK